MLDLRSYGDFEVIFFLSFQLAWCSFEISVSSLITLAVKT